jgi:hypothetical protein
MATQSSPRAALRFIGPKSNQIKCPCCLEPTLCNIEYVGELRVVNNQVARVASVARLNYGGLY